jgi:transposase
MPWRETSPMDQRSRFIGDYLAGLASFTEVCARYGVSRRIGYKWVNRYEAEGPPGLRDQSRRPHGCPHATSREVVEHSSSYDGTILPGAPRSC